ncbi:MAG TPA: hypothetical protein VMV80_08145, partial [Anaerolineales bacterium]|nr:hypothetical protein [Anaerolineales bacterium]
MVHPGIRSPVEPALIKGSRRVQPCTFCSAFISTVLCGHPVGLTPLSPRLAGRWFTTPAMTLEVKGGHRT